MERLPSKSALEKEVKAWVYQKIFEEVTKEINRLADLSPEPIDLGPTWYERLSNIIVGFFLNNSNKYIKLYNYITSRRKNKTDGC